MCIVVIKNYSVCCGQFQPAQTDLVKNDYYMKIGHINGTNNYYMKIGDINVSIMSLIFI